MRKFQAIGASIALAAVVAWCEPAPAFGQDTPRDGTRLEMIERFCGRNEKCKHACRLEIAQGRTVQGVIVELGQSLLDMNWANSDRAYDGMTRALMFSHDFMSTAELGAGQTEFQGRKAEALRLILGDAAWVCEVRGAFPSKYICLKRRLLAFEPGWP